VVSRRTIGLALAVAALAAPGSASAAKVTETAPGGVVPNASGGGGLAVVEGEFIQTFTLKGSKVKGKQVLDVNLTMNSTGNVPDATDDLNAMLISPSGDNASVPIPSLGQSFTNLTFDDQSRLIPCDPFERVTNICNYISGATAASSDAGSFTGALDAARFSTGFNPEFKGDNPKGTWTLRVSDVVTNLPGTLQIATLGTSTLEVKTGKKFAKEGGK
jgi:hypothetical protein